MKTAPLPRRPLPAALLEHPPRLARYLGRMLATGATAADLQSFRAQLAEHGTGELLREVAASYEAETAARTSSVRYPHPRPRVL